MHRAKIITLAFKVQITRSGLSLRVTSLARLNVDNGMLNVDHGMLKSKTKKLSSSQKIYRVVIRI